MDRAAIFVDAGYLFAQGSTALSGSKIARNALVLDAPKAIDSLKKIAALKSHDCKLLRIYWYDGTIAGARPTTDHATLAHLDDVKLRLGFINSYGQQKGVDSLIVTDLIELARLKSITDAILLSGDEDVRVGVQIAQNYGVRVHLLGIFPSRGSQSPQLLQEADTTTEWLPDNIKEFLSIREESCIDDDKSIIEHNESEISIATLADDSSKIEIAVKEFVGNLEASELQGVETYWKTDRGVPADLDKKLLPTCGRAIGRSLVRSEMRQMRAVFQKAVRDRNFAKK